MLKLCPTCHRDLDEVERMGVLVDICPKCHGIWLDAGKLEQVGEAIRTMESSDDAPATAPYFVKVYETSTRCSRESTFTPRNASFDLLDIFRRR